MKKNEMIIVGIIVAVMLIILGIVIINKNKNSVTDNEPQNTINTTNEEFTNVQSDGTKINTSNKLAETKKFDGLEISNITLTEKNGESYLRAIVKNTTSQTKGNEMILLTIINKEGKTLTTINGYLDTIEAGETSMLSIKTSADFANAYDFKVSK